LPGAQDYYKTIKGKYPGVPSWRAHIIFPGSMLWLTEKYFYIIFKIEILIEQQKSDHRKDDPFLGLREWSKGI
jgi:hypothetical protein